MTAGLLQLVAKDVEDMYLVSQPQITFFKVLYRRHTMFAIESLQQDFSNPANFGNTVTCTLSKTGDLVNTVTVYVEIPAIPPFIDQLTGKEDRFKKMAWVRNLGYALIQEVSIEIGGELIDKQYGEWMYIWQEVSQSQELDGIDKMIGNIPEIYKMTNGKESYALYIPLKFWFCLNPGSSIPIVALQSDVKINITFRNFQECVTVGPTNYIEILEDIITFKPGDYIEQTVNGESIYGYVIDFDYLTRRLYYIKIVSPSASERNFRSLQEVAPATILNNPDYANNIPYRIYNSLTATYCTPKPNTVEVVLDATVQPTPTFGRAFLYVDYVYLDSAERARFVKNSHEYLITQLIYNRYPQVNSANVRMRLSLKNLCKAMYWVSQLDSIVGPNTINDRFNFTTSHIRYPDGSFYGVNPVKEAVIQLNGENRFSPREGYYFNLYQPYEHQTRGPETGINMYSFCLFPESHQPSGTLNASMINDISLVMSLQNNAKFLSPLAQGNLISTKNTVTIKNYTLTYNILRIAFSIAGLAY